MVTCIYVCKWHRDVIVNSFAIFFQKLKFFCISLAVSFSYFKFMRDQYDTTINQNFRMNENNMCFRRQKKRCITKKVWNRRKLKEKMSFLDEIDIYGEKNRLIRYSWMIKIQICSIMAFTRFLSLLTLNQIPFSYNFIKSYATFFLSEEVLTKEPSIRHQF